jgi:hyperosmotically inducible periplasmic protein
MVRISNKLTQILLLAGSFAFCTAALASAPPYPGDPQQTQPDNTKRNRDQSPPTADQQKDNESDRTITQRIRKSIMAEKSFSTDAHNVKIITQDGKVTLRGPVRSDDEKKQVQAKAAAVVGEGNVICLIEVAPSK